MQVYTDPSRENEPEALPNAEVFYAEAGELDEYFEGASLEGWYWWACFPGCLPDGEPNGPFETEEEARADAQEED